MELQSFTSFQFCILLVVEEEVGDSCCSSEIWAGDVFASYEELKMKLNTYKQERFVAFWKRDSCCKETWD